MESKAGAVRATKPRFRLIRSSCKVVIVTPEMALRWLGNNPHNRAIREERIAAALEYQVMASLPDETV